MRRFLTKQEWAERADIAERVNTKQAYLELTDPEAAKLCGLKLSTYTHAKLCRFNRNGHSVRSASMGPSTMKQLDKFLARKS